MTCSVVGCERSQYCRRLCRSHYDRQRRGQSDWDGPIKARKPIQGRACSVYQCGRPAHAHVEGVRLCLTHSHRARAGEPDWSRPLREYPLARRRMPNGEARTNLNIRIDETTLQALQKVAASRGRMTPRQLAGDILEAWARTAARGRGGDYQEEIAWTRRALDEWEAA